jgi:predicted peptidase
MAQEMRSFAREIRKTVGAQYLLFLPEGYGKDPAQRWPLILFLHGSGERGDDLNLVKRHGPPKLVEEEPERFPFIVVSPQCPAGAVWDLDTLTALLDEVLAQFAVDENRVYLTGLSMGGHATFALGIREHERFAAIAPICGSGNPIWVKPEHRRVAAWVFHGAKDQVIRLSESEKMVRALEQVGAEVRFTVYPEADHDAWTETYANPALYEWFLQHKR